jgi:hypothetical protein
VECRRQTGAVVCHRQGEAAICRGYPYFNSVGLAMADRVVDRLPGNAIKMGGGGVVIDFDSRIASAGTADIERFGRLLAEIVKGPLNRPWFYASCGLNH